MSGIREGRWRCPRCDSENLGRHLECTSCGDTRDDGVTFYLPGDEPEVSDEQLLARAAAGADRLCEFCDASNPPEADVCQGCSAPLGDRRRPQGAEPAVQTLAAPSPAPSRRPQRPRRSRRLPREPRSRRRLWGCLSLIVLVVGGLVAGRLWQREVTLTVTGVSWHRAFDAEKLVTVERTGWEGELPAGARPQSRRRAVREHRRVEAGTRTEVEREQVRVQVSTERVQVGVRDLGNGFFEDVYEDRPVYERQTRIREVVRPVYREEPVYDTEVTYLIDEWQVVRRAEARGDDLEPRWPELASGERERPGSRTEKLQVRFRSTRGKRYHRDVPDTLFGRYPPGSRHVATIDRFGVIRALRVDR